MDFLKLLNKNIPKSAIVFCCVEVVVLQEGSYLFNYLQVKSKDNKLEIVAREKGISEFENLKKNLKKEIPIVIAITGRGVLTKKLESAQLKDENNYLKYILPNAASDDFIVQSQSNDFGSTFCAVARRNEVELVTELFTSSDLFVIGLSIGILCIGSIISLLDLNQNKMVFGDHKIQLKNNQIVEISPNKYRKQDYEYQIGNEEIDQDLIIAFAAGFQYFILNQKSDLSENSLLREAEYKYYKRFKATKMSFLVACFIALLLNFFFFDHFNKLASGLNNELASYDKLLSNHTYLKAELESKDKIVKSLGLEQDLRFSFIADQIASTVTIPITLLELNLFPLKNARNKELEFAKNKLLISGTTKSANELNIWIKSVRKFTWVNSLTITDFSYSDKEGIAGFEIELMLIDQLN